MHLHVGERVEIGFGRTVSSFTVAVEPPMVGIPDQGIPQAPVKKPAENAAVLRLTGKDRSRVRVPIDHELVGPRWIVISLSLPRGAAYYPVAAQILAR
jgi:hypothetical protein